MYSTGWPAATVSDESAFEVAWPPAFGVCTRAIQIDVFSVRAIGVATGREQGHLSLGGMTHVASYEMMEGEAGGCCHEVRFETRRCVRNQDAFAAGAVYQGPAGGAYSAPQAP